MVPGDPGKDGLNVPRLVGEDLNIAPDPVTLQFLPMVEMIARGNLQSQHPATNTSVSYKIQNILPHITASVKLRALRQN